MAGGPERFAALCGCSDSRAVWISFSSIPAPYRRMAAGMAASAPVAQGEETLQVTVSVSWAIRQQGQ